MNMHKRGAGSLGPTSQWAEGMPRHAARPSAAGGRPRDEPLTCPGAPWSEGDVAAGGGRGPLGELGKGGGAAHVTGGCARRHSRSRLSRR